MLSDVAAARAAPDGNLRNIMRALDNTEFCLGFKREYNCHLLSTAAPPAKLNRHIWFS